MTTLEEIKKNPQVLEFIKQTELVLSALNFTDHGLRHAELVSERARKIAKDIGLSQKDQELSGIVGFCHDMGNFISRSYHNYFASLLFHQIFKDEMEPGDLAIVMQGLANHDKITEDIAFTNPISAVAILADKSDVHRSRVTITKMEDIKSDIHDRVNYATTSSDIKVDENKKKIILTLKIDTNFVPVIEYFEIFTSRMVFCRKAAEYLGYEFGLVINKFRLL
ncbi:HD domain-containing protein [Patescibacteria group bacterium]|nr:HD domain-containing protein [Patescibacteria group bacterium]